MLIFSSRLSQANEEQLNTPVWLNNKNRVLFVKYGLHEIFVAFQQE